MSSGRATLTRPPTPEGAGLRRGFAFLVLAALFVMGVAVDEGIGARSSKGSWVPRPQADPEPQALVTRPGTLSSSWYCAEGTSVEGGRADESVAIANAGEEPLDAVITVMRGEEAPVRKPFAVPPRSRLVVRIADIVPIEEPGVVVEVFGPDAAVEHVLRGTGGDLDALPCARRPATQWFFAGGSTRKDTRDFIALFNPFEDAATVDMTFFTEEGLLAPEDLQALEVPPRSRITVPVHEYVLRKAVVAAELITRSGRIVAERSLHFDGTTGRRGMAVYPGVNETAETWFFPEGIVQGRIFETVWVLNPGRADTAVEIQPELDGDAVQEPTMVSVPGRSAVAVRLNDADAEGFRPVPPDVGHSLRISAVGDEDVVVAQQIIAADGAARPGSAVVSGSTAPARKWMFVAGSADDTVDEWITIMNPGAETGGLGEAAQVSISVLAGGVLLVPEGLGTLEIAPRRRAAFRLGDALKRSDLPLIVEADQDVIVVRGLFEASAVSYSPGIPFPLG